MGVRYVTTKIQEVIALGIRGETKLKRGQLHETLYVPDLLFPDSFYYPAAFPLRIIEPYFGEGYTEVKYNDWIK